MKIVLYESPHKVIKYIFEEKGGFMPVNFGNASIGMNNCPLILLILVSSVLADVFHWDGTSYSIDLGDGEELYAHLCRVPYRFNLVEQFVYNEYGDCALAPPSSNTFASFAIEDSTLILKSLKIYHCIHKAMADIPLNIFDSSATERGMNMEWYSDTLRFVEYDQTSDVNRERIAVFKKGKVVQYGEKICRRSPYEEKICAADSLYKVLDKTEFDDYTYGKSLFMRYSLCMFKYKRGTIKYDSCGSKLEWAATQDSLRELKDAEENQTRRCNQENFPNLSPYFKELQDKVGGQYER